MVGLRCCTLVLEFNYGKASASLGSVWILDGDGSVDLTSSSALSSMPGWVKVVGPVDYEIAVSITSSLRQFLEGCGVTVISDAITD